MLARGWRVAASARRAAQSAVEHQHRAQLFNGVAVSRRGVSNYAAKRTTELWEDPEKRELAKEFTKNTTVKTHHPKRKEGLAVPPKPESRKHVHPTVKHALGRTYGIMDDAVDKIPFRCAEHALGMRVAVVGARSPSARVREAIKVMTTEVFKTLTTMDERTFNGILAVGSDKSESRSKELFKDKALFMRYLSDQNLPSQQHLRMLESFISPLGMIANVHGGRFCRIAGARGEMDKAKARGEVVDRLLGLGDLGDLDRFISRDVMPWCASFNVPYIKTTPGSPFVGLQFKAYKEGEPISDEDLFTESHFLECLHSNSRDIPDVPQLRSVKVVDDSGRSIMLHERLNIPHFFNVSGTTGAVMQVAIALIHKAGRQDLVDTPEKIEELGMILAGCNFYKQGFHNFHEVLPALSWVIHHVLHVPYKQRTCDELIEDVPAVLARSIDKDASKAAKLVTPVLELITEHAKEHRIAYNAHVKEKMAQQQKQEATGPTLGGSSGDD